MLTVAEERIREVAEEYNKSVSIHLYGQEVADETYAIAKSDMLVKGEGGQSNNIFSDQPFPMTVLLEEPLISVCPIPLLGHHGRRI